MTKKVAILVLLLSNFVPAFGQKASAASSTLLITRLQTASAVTATEEFIEISNVSTEAIDVTGWKVEYLTAQGNLSNPPLEILSGTMQPGDFVLLAREGYLPDAPIHFTNGLSDSGGHVRIRDQDDLTVDLLGWGTAVQPEGTVAQAPAPGRWLERRVSTDDKLVDTDDNSADFSLNVLDAQEQPEGISLCDGLVLSEILPNPIGTDTGHEFIELHNPTGSAVLLGGCSLALADKTYDFDPTMSIQPGEYKAFYDNQTGLTLPNAAGGEVALISSTTESVVQYPAEMNDGEAWAWAGAAWQSTATPTPNQTNVFTLSAEGGSGGDEEISVSSLSPCPLGKYRNPETNRCKSIEADEGLTPCLPGQTRNPETNRCRSVLTASTSLTPCKEGQERNPETNRCRSVQGATSALAPCKEGEERNPETNRCRKITAATADVAKADTPANNGPSKANYAIIALIATSALGYGVYEYRQDIRNWMTSTKSRLFAKSGDK